MCGLGRIGPDARRFRIRHHANPGPGIDVIGIEGLGALKIILVEAAVFRAAKFVTQRLGRAHGGALTIDWMKCREGEPGFVPEEDQVGFDS